MKLTKSLTIAALVLAGLTTQALYAQAGTAANGPTMMHQGTGTYDRLRKAGVDEPTARVAAIRQDQLTTIQGLTAAAADKPAIAGLLAQLTGANSQQTATTAVTMVNQRVGTDEHTVNLSDKSYTFDTGADSQAGAWAKLQTIKVISTGQTFGGTTGNPQAWAPLTPATQSNKSFVSSPGQPG